MTRVMQEHQGREAVLEVELGAEDLLALSQTRPTRPLTMAPGVAAEFPTPAPKRQRLSRIQIGVGAASLVAVLIGVAVDRSPGIEQHARAVPAAPLSVATMVPVPTAPVAAALPVKFRNPFDRSEVFEFPAGTSRAEARARVADLLMKRAQERRVQYKRGASHRTRVASR